jgi:IclR family mhp operon transcriptional activator
VASYVPVNSVVRAIRLLKELNRFPVSTLDQLYIQTKIPKPTIIRLLQTLEAQDIVRHAPQHGTYYLTSNVLSLSSGYHAEPKLIEASAPLMDELTKQIRWPLSIAALEGDRMAVRYSTIPESSLSILHSNIGMQLSLVTRSLGCAYLAYCAADIREALLDRLKSSHDPEDTLALDRKSINKLLAEVRKRGMATRDSFAHPLANTLAVPVISNRTVVAALGLSYLTSSLDADTAVSRYKDVLTDLSRRIGKNLDAQTASRRTGNRSNTTGKADAGPKPSG